MVTELIQIALDLYSNITRLLSRCPIEYDTKRRILIFNKKNTFWCYCNVLGITFTLGVGPIVTVLVRQTISPKANVTGIHSLLYLLMSVFAILVFGAVLTVIVFSELNVKTYNEVMNYCLKYAKGESYLKIEELYF